MNTREYGIPIGLKNIHFAELKHDSESGATYEKPFKIGDSISIKPTFEFAEGSLDAENKRIRDEAEIVGVKFQINIASLSPVNHARILGHRVDANGGIVVDDGDMPLEGALLYETTLDTGEGKLSCYYKGVFKEFAEEAQTKQKGARNYQTPTIEFSAYRRSDGKLSYMLSEEMPGYSKEIAAKWFEEVPTPSALNMESTAQGASASVPVVTVPLTAPAAAKTKETDLASMTKAQLLEYAESLGVAVSAQNTKAEIMEAIEKLDIK